MRGIAQSLNDDGQHTPSRVRRTLPADVLDDFTDDGASEYLVGATCCVWEDELYAYGGLTPEGEFVTTITRWSGRGQTTEVPAQPSDARLGIPPGRYGHTAVVVKDLLYVFGGQGQYGSLNDLWVFDFEACTWSLIDVVGAPPSARAGHCACLSDDVMFIFGGKDVQPGSDAVTYNDLYGFDVKESEWLTIETKWRRPAGGDGCAMASSNGILYVLSSSDATAEMLVWCLQLSAHGALRWTQVPRSGQLPTPRTNYVACTYGPNWVIHGGRVLHQEQALGDTYVFHFSTAEWARLDPKSDTDPRFSHAGATVDGALVLLHGKRNVDAMASTLRDPEKDTGVCIAINLESYIMFPDGYTENESTAGYSAFEKASKLKDSGEVGTGIDVEGDDPELAAFETESVTKMNAKMMNKLNKKGVTGQKGGLLGGSLHVGHKGNHFPGDVELIAGNVKLHAHRDIIVDSSPGLAKLMELRPMAGALKRQPDLVEFALAIHPVAGQVLGMFVHLLHVFIVVVTFSIRGAMLTGTGSRRVTLVFPDMRVPVLVAMLRWMYRIPLHPGRDILVELCDAGIKYEVKGLENYCIHRMRMEMCAEIAAGASRIARQRDATGLWKSAVRCAQVEWGLVRYSQGMADLVQRHPETAKAFTLAVHSTITIEEA